MYKNTSQDYEMSKSTKLFYDYVSIPYHLIFIFFVFILSSITVCQKVNKYSLPELVSSENGTQKKTCSEKSSHQENSHSINLSSNETNIQVSSIRLGNGSVEEPYILCTYNDLKGIRADKEGYYVLGANIDASPSSMENEGLGFIPIGSFLEPFTGNIDGKGFSIQNLYINRPDASFVAFIAFAKDASIKNLSLQHATIKGLSQVATLIANNTSSTREMVSVENCFVSGKVMGWEQVGGLIAINERTTIAWNTSTVSLESDFDLENRDLGGIVGFSNTSTIESNTFLGKIITNPMGGFAIGGIVGYLDGNSMVINNFTKNLIRTPAETGFQCGGIVGVSYRSKIITNISESSIECSGMAGQVLGQDGGDNVIKASITNETQKEN